MDDPTADQVQHIDLAPMPDSYTQLLARAAETLFADQRVRALSLHGAIGRGGQDAGSDLDLTITVAATAIEQMAADHERWIADITESVSAQQMGGATGWYVLTPTCERVDFLLESVDDLSTTPHRRRITVFDKDDLLGRVPAPDDPGPSPTAIEFAIREPLRQMANFPIVFIRRDWLMGVVAVQQLHYFLYLLFAEDNKPQAPSGPKQWSYKLDRLRQDQLEQLPIPQPEPDAIRAAWTAAVTLLRTQAPDIARRHGVDWPADLEHAVTTYLRNMGYLPTNGSPERSR